MLPVTLFYRIRPALMKMAFVTLRFLGTRDRNEGEVHISSADFSETVQTRNKSSIYH